MNKTQTKIKEITEKIIIDLEKGTAPWVKPWASSLPQNFKSKRPYSGLNFLRLMMIHDEENYSSPYWLTFKQVDAMKGTVKKGSKGVPVFYVGNIKKTEEVDGESVDKEFFFLKTYFVFNLDQTNYIKKPEVREIKISEDIETFIGSIPADISYESMDTAGFSPSTDKIKIPTRSKFKDDDNYYATVFHELAHWTGHKSRLDRNLDTKFGNESYAFEELVAELSAAFLCARFGVKGQLQHTAYIGSWIKILENNYKAIQKAASLAQKAMSFLLKFNEKEEVMAA